MLLVEGKHQDCLRPSNSFGCVVEELIVINFLNFGDIANVCTAVGIYKLSIEGLIASNSAIVILKLVKADYTDFDAGLS